MAAFLAIETSGTVGSVAVSIDGSIMEQTIATPREQTERLLPLVQALLEQTATELGALDAIVFGQGPGSFTGLRIAAAVAQGLALAARLPVIGVSSLAATAQRAWADQRIGAALVCVDARMGEVYWGRFAIRGGLARALDAERIGAPESVIMPDEPPWTGLGGGFAAYEQALAPLTARAERIVADIAPRAQDLLPQAAADFAAGRVLEAAAALPVYLREATAWRR